MAAHGDPDQGVSMVQILNRPAFDVECEAVLAPMQAALGPITRESIPALRSGGTPLDLDAEALAAAGLTWRDVAIPGHLGDEIEVSVIARADHTGLGPGIFHTHGGGMIAGDRMVDVDGLIPAIQRHDAVLVTVEYRLAPEFPDPYPVEDCYAVLPGNARVRCALSSGSRVPRVVPERVRSTQRTREPHRSARGTRACRRGRAGAMRSAL
ncbi:MAG: alpha/beta hydrolase [Arthrobacter sp.]|jgi:hypothetical protein|nr:alpha/beta hydrolase [Arthrobacter sp.]